MPNFYVLCGTDPNLGRTAIESVLASGYSGKLYLMNNMDSDVSLLFSDLPIEIVDAPVKLTMAQTANWIVKLAIKQGQDRIFTLPDDAIIKPGAIEPLLEKYEEIKNEKWLNIGYPSSSAFFTLANLNAYEEEQVWWDTFLFPMYWCDYHWLRIMRLRGWQDMFVEERNLVEHLGSENIKRHPGMRMRNYMIFEFNKATYEKIWGGEAGHETITDITAGGLENEGINNGD